MFKLPTQNDVCKLAQAPFVATEKMNAMLKALSNKLPCRLGPWKMNQTNMVIKKKDLLKELPLDVDLTESYVYDYNRFLSPGKTCYVRMNIFYSNITSISEIQSVISTFKQPREQFFELSHSSAPNPVQIGTLTGSVKAMATSPDF